jgi:acetyl esterase/lipase
MLHILSATVACLALLASGRAYAGEPAKSVPSSKLYKVKTFRNITYHEVPHDPNRDRHQLDVFRPKGQTGQPVLFFVHGGGWMISGKDDVFGIYGYGTIAYCLAQRGLVVVSPNYRLSPGVKHPEHIKDVARAFAWTCQNIGKYGGDRKQIFVVGHSAGGHLVSLLATDPTYLKGEGRSPKDIQGVIAIS